MRILRTGRAVPCERVQCDAVTRQRPDHMTPAILAMFLGIAFAIAMVPALRAPERPDPCGAFTIGQSAIGGCDGVGGSSLTP